MKNNSFVVWDWNGTLVDDSYVFVEIMNKFLLDYSLPKITLNDYKKHFCFPVEKYYVSLGFQLTSSEFKDLSEQFIRLYKQKMFKPKLKNNILHVVNDLKKRGFSQYILSAQEQKLLGRSVDYYGVRSLFCGVFGLNNNFAVSKVSVAKQKIKPLISKGGRALFIGDTKHDLEVAQSLGADCCLVSWGHNEPSRLYGHGCFVADSPASLLSFINTFINN